MPCSVGPLLRVAAAVDNGRMDMTELERAEVELGSLLRKCEAVVHRSTLSPSRQTLMTNRVAALRTALELVAKAKSHSQT